MLCQTLRFFAPKSTRNLHTTKCMLYFFEKDNRRGFPVLYDRPPKIEKGFIKQSLQSLRILRQEFKKFGEELKEKFSFAPTVIYRTGEVDIVYRFNTDQKCLDEWTVTCDSDYNTGFSSAKLEISPRGTGIFSGYIDTRIPKDGKITHSGYANITKTPRLKSFFRQIPYEWGPYTHMVFRVRGDGRTYLITLAGKQDLDMTFFDLHSYLLYTRGGPYWQYTRIPFSKFFFVSKGAVQDHQGVIQQNNVLKIGITIADKITGPFQLEIDYIGVEFDESHKEEFAYESYRFSKPMV